MPTRLTTSLPGPLTGARVVPGPGGRAGAGAPGDAHGQEGPRGVEETLQADREDLARARDALRAAAARLADLRAQVVKEFEAHVADLAIDIARKVLMQEIQADRYQIEPIVQEALRRAPSGREAVVRLNPQDLARMEQSAEGGAATLSPLVRLVGDPTIRRAECIVEMAEGTVEARAEDELEQIAVALKRPE